ncbi:MAG: ABC transporter permease [Flavobacteriales bacterium]|nr:ABC transporter permease [Flavobacteriales bacterium]
MIRIIKFVILDIIKNKIVLAYTLLLAIFAWSAFSLEDTSAKGVLSLLNIILLIVPLVSVLFTTIYIYNSAEFVELLTSQPIKRNKIWISLFIGLSGSMAIAFFLGAGVPLFIYTEPSLSLIMVSIGMLISLVFVSLAFLSASITRDKAKGIGMSIMLWLYFALLFDALVLFLLFQLSDYPIEKMMIGITATSPIDLARILILLHLDVSAMMGYTGAIFKKFFGSAEGMVIAFFLLTLWVAIPYYISLRIFKRKDL